ncbi:hypothetical protein [Streptomyces sp. NPDC058985]|uniref:hypothetical protein n=1 Tax=Streptomyces sp. NPDC058985 TaxID=3346684 RepID=UPI0036B88D84
MATTTAVSRFFAGRDFTVASRTVIAGLRVEATDGPFTTGSGDLLRGPTLSLVMGMAGRAAACDDLEGDGAAILRARLLSASADRLRRHRGAGRAR